MSIVKGKIVTILDNEKYLRQISKPIKILKDNDLLDDIEHLDKYCKENEVMAMAAIQLGIPKRLIYLKNTNLDIIERMQKDCETDDDKLYNESKILINPVILKKEGLTEYWENCASCLDNSGLVYRPYKIKIKFYDQFNKQHTRYFEGFEATVLSHELDHLDGILHIDIAEKIINLPLEDRKKWRQKYGYKIYYKSKDYDKLKILQQKNNG